MNLGLAATVFGVIFLAELPDKTMIATLIMGSKGNAKAVWAGASIAFVAQVTIATVAGRFLNRLPHRALEIIVTVLFLGGALYLLAFPEKQEIAEGDRDAALETPGAFIPTALGALGVIFIAEFGDLTQLLTASFVARSGHALVVFFAASLALISVAALGAFGGRALLRILPLARIRQGGGVILLGFGIYSLVNILVSS